jgi:hypothetical protein|tara:strand:- start:9 stop:212 length:204 start_codon:yes stop_codon:yes gene_type:complete
VKEIVLILLLSTTGIEEVKLKHHGNCDGIANAWVDVNMTYYPMVNGNPKLQGWYNADGKLLLGWLCK